MQVSYGRIRSPEALEPDVDDERITASVIYTQPFGYRTDHVRAGTGALVSKYALPDELKPLYGSDPTSGMIFGRIKVQ